MLTTTGDLLASLHVKVTAPVLSRRGFFFGDTVGTRCYNHACLSGFLSSLGDSRKGKSGRRPQRQARVLQ